jgi:hypothetical protein
MAKRISNDNKNLYKNNLLLIRPKLRETQKRKCSRNWQWPSSKFGLKE